MSFNSANLMLYPVIFLASYMSTFGSTETMSDVMEAESYFNTYKPQKKYQNNASHCFYA